MLEIVNSTFNYVITMVGNNPLCLRQSKGVPMGGTLSYFISEIVTGKAVAKMLAGIPKEGISFLYKYVDDMFLSTDAHGIGVITQELKTSLDGVNLKITGENNLRKITFLEFTASAKGRDIKFSWYRKEFGSDRMIDFYSGHSP